MAKMVNPVHFKPMWTLLRLGADPRFTPGDDTLMFSDAELISLRAMVEGAIITARSDPDENTMLHKIALAAESALEKLKSIINTELEVPDDDTERTNNTTDD